MKKRYSISVDECRYGLNDFYENVAKIIGEKITEKAS